jgi:hypothetical protein
VRQKWSFRLAQDRLAAYLPVRWSEPIEPNEANEHFSSAWFEDSHMSTYYFVAFESRSKPDGLVKTVSNVILRDVHPVIWLANPPEAYTEYWVGYLLFWAEILEDVAIEGGKYTPIEGPGESFSVREGMAKAFNLL